MPSAFFLIPRSMSRDPGRLAPVRVASVARTLGVAGGHENLRLFCCERNFIKS